MTQHTNIPLTRLEPGRDDLEGVCPECGKSDGFYDVGRSHWVVCSKHMVRWHAADRVEVDDPDEPFDLDGEEAAWRNNAKTLKAYKVVLADFPPLPEMPRVVRQALNAVLDFLWTGQACAYADAPQPSREDHLFRQLHVLDCWMMGRMPTLVA